MSILNFIREKDENGNYSWFGLYGWMWVIVLSPFLFALVIMNLP
jgi:hypothetical protein